ncbi:MAG: hypothetical protein AAGN66_26840, partial [Acidobacteriota bacterium]
QPEDTSDPSRNFTIPLLAADDPNLGNFRYVGLERLSPSVGFTRIYSFEQLASREFLEVDIFEDGSYEVRPTGLTGIYQMADVTERFRLPEIFADGFEPGNPSAGSSP